MFHRLCRAAFKRLLSSISLGFVREDTEVKRMKKLWLLPLVAIPFLAVRSQEPVPAGFEHWPTASVQTMAPALAADAAKDPRHFAVKQLSDFPNESFLLVHREADGSPELHETQVDVMFVQSSTATLVLGGTLLNAETVAPHEKRNGTIQGGVRQKLSVGDVVRVPSRTPHQLLLDGAREITYFVVKVKGY
jgi:mannose-6-phosphate isomerase-like protein (cupin superfamily)